MIANKVKTYLEGSGSEIPKERMDVALGLMEHSLRRNLGDNSAERGGRKVRMPRPSGTWACGREMVFKSLALNGEPYGWRSRLTFTHGDITEAMGVMLYRQALDSTGESKILLSPADNGEQLELDVEFDPSVWGVEGEKFRLKGHMDMTLDVHGHGESVVDWKALSVYSFNDVQAAAGDSDHPWWAKEAGGYVAQVRWYMMMLRLSGRGDGKWGAIVAVNKNTGHLAEAVIPYDHDAEVALIRKAVYTARMIAEASERRAIVLQDSGDGDEATDIVLAEWVREFVPRAKFTKNMVVQRGTVMRPDGTKGKCFELDTSRAADPEAFRCSYCDFTELCYDGFSVVALAKPVYRTNGI
ncbi:MAG: hypothetical protein DRH30_07895 [Deltaproteobacteria bacterium]|nr:MAG: hypothetical protein DRH30_07895 [Deltaproteobacteria bacterium]